MQYLWWNDKKNNWLVDDYVDSFYAAAARFSRHDIHTKLGLIISILEHVFRAEV